jgi:hypothetical protein
LDFLSSSWTDTPDDDSEWDAEDDADGWDECEVETEDEPPVESTDKNRDFPTDGDGNGDAYKGGAACPL